MTEFRPYKFVVQAVVQTVEDDAVVNEVAAEPVTLFGTAALAAWAEGFTDELKKAEAQTP